MSGNIEVRFTTIDEEIEHPVWLPSPPRAGELVRHLERNFKVVTVAWHTNPLHVQVWIEEIK